MIDRYPVQGLTCQDLSSLLSTHDEGLHGLNRNLNPTKHEEFAKSKLWDKNEENYNLGKKSMISDNNKLQCQCMGVTKELRVVAHSPPRRRDHC